MIAKFESIEDFARFCCECVRQGCTFEAYPDEPYYVVKFTGGC